jgi:NDP-sugar pyrophosphorylase family protein
VKLGDGVTLGNRVKLGDGVKLGDWVTLGNGVTLGDGVKLGDWVKLGDGVTLGKGVTLGDWVKLGDGVTLGKGVTLGNRVTLGDWVKLEHTPLQVQCHPYIVYAFSPTQIGVGCVVHDLSYWQRDGDPDELQDHPECLPWSVYRRAIDLVIQAQQRTAIDVLEALHRQIHRSKMPAGKPAEVEGE